MNSQHRIFLLVLSALALYGVLLYEFEVPHGNAASPLSAPVPSNVNVVNNPAVHVINTPTVQLQEHNWQYRAVIIPKAFPGTPEWNNFVEQLNGFGQQGWELVNIAESVALLKKPL